jgi:hypothetical protein
MDDALPLLMILRELRVLNLSFNDFQELPRPFFKEIVLLEELYLSGNHLLTLPQELRALPAFASSPSHGSEPIQAVCLPYSDEEADAKRFGTLRNVKPPSTTTHTPSTSLKGSTPIDVIADAFKGFSREHFRTQRRS